MVSINDTDYVYNNCHIQSYDHGICILTEQKRTVTLDLDSIVSCQYDKWSLSMSSPIINENPVPDNHQSILLLNRILFMNSADQKSQFTVIQQLFIIKFYHMETPVNQKWNLETDGSGALKTYKIIEINPEQKSHFVSEYHCSWNRNGCIGFVFNSKIKSFYDSFTAKYLNFR